MEHNIFKFSILCSTTSNTAEFVLNDYFTKHVKGVEFDGAMVHSIKIEHIKDYDYKVELELEARDYGVSQVGVHIVGEYVREIYTEQFEEGEHDIYIDVCKIHPHENGKGALICWDYNEDQPIVKEIISE